MELLEQDEHGGGDITAAHRCGWDRHDPLCRSMRTCSGGEVGLVDRPVAHERLEQVEDRAIGVGDPPQGRGGQPAARRSAGPPPPCGRRRRGRGPTPPPRRAGRPPRCRRAARRTSGCAAAPCRRVRLRGSEIAARVSRSDAATVSSAPARTLWPEPVSSACSTRASRARWACSPRMARRTSMHKMFSVPSQMVWHWASRSWRAMGQSSMYPLPPRTSRPVDAAHSAMRVQRILASGTRMRRTRRPDSASWAPRAAAAHS